jgi:hypothetical protein
MARIIRLTEQDLTRIVRRVINEDQAAQKQQLESKMKSCFDPNKYPIMYSLVATQGYSLLAVGAAAMTVGGFATGNAIVGGLSATLALFMVGYAVEELVNVIKEHKNSNMLIEVKAFVKCVTGSM